MKKAIIGCLFILLTCASAQASETIQKTLSLGQWAVDSIMVASRRGQFVGHDGESATIFRQRDLGTINIWKDLPAYIYLSSIIVKVEYDGGSVLHISYEK